MKEYFDQLVFDQFNSQCALLCPGEISDCKGLVESDFWFDIVPSERRYVFGRPLSRYVEQGLLPLEFVGFNKQRHNLYRRIQG